MVKIGLVGCGKIAQKHMEAYKRLEMAEVIVTDTDRGRALRFGEQHGVPVVGSYAELLSTPEIEVIDVCVPTSSHREVVLSAFEHKKHVFSEKPLCETHQEAFEIYGAAERNKRLIWVGFPFRFYPAMRFVKELLDQNVIGKPHMAQLRIGGRGSAAVWKHKMESGGGSISEMMVHLIDLGVWLFGTMDGGELIWSDTLLKQRLIAGEVVDADAEDVAIARLFRKDDLTVLCQSDLCTPSYMQSIEVQGENGSIYSSLLDYLPTVVFCRQPAGPYPAGYSQFNFPVTNIFVEELRYFLERVRRPDGWNDIINSLNVVRLYEEIHEAARGSRR